MAQAVVRRSRAKLRSAIGDESNIMCWNFAPDLQEMMKVLEVIEPVLEGTERYSLRDAASREWLRRVRDAAYGISDMVDELQDRRPRKTAGISVVPKKNTMSNRMKDMRRELTLLQESQRFASTMPETIGVQLKQPPSPSPPRPILPSPPPASPTMQFLPPPPPFTTGYLPLPPSPLPEAKPRPTKLLGAPGSVALAHMHADEGNIVGRGENKQRIIATLSAIDITQGPAILPIFGLAAVGKTALAEMVFKDAGFGEYKFRIWVNVTPKFDLPQIGNHIISKILQEINLEMENQRGRRPCGGSQVWEEEMSTYTHAHSQESEEKINQATYSPLWEVEEETENGSDWASQVLPEEINKGTYEISNVSEDEINKGSDGTSQVLAELINKGSDGVSQLSEEEINKGSDGTSQVLPEVVNKGSNGVSQLSEEEINNCSDGISRVLAEQINKGTCEIAKVLEDQEISTGVDGIPPPVKEEQRATWDYIFGPVEKLPRVSEEEISKGSDAASQVSEEGINYASDGTSRVLADQTNKGTCEITELLENQEISTSVDGIPPVKEEQRDTWDYFFGPVEKLPRVSEEEISKGSDAASQVSEEGINYASDGTSRVLADQINKGTCEITELLENQELSTGVDGIPPPESVAQMVTRDYFLGPDEKLPRVTEEEVKKGSDGNSSYGTSRVLAEETHQDSNDVDYITKRLHGLLNGMKALIVLDDVWEEDSDELERLKHMLGVGIKGSKVNVIVTTCNQGIARKVCTVVKPYKLDPLINDMCWTIIKQKSGFGNRPDSDKKELEQIGPQIASKCGGLPLAAQELGRSLHHRDARSWAEAMNRDIWSNIKSDNDVILRSLELSYISLAPALRLCFAYWAIFPQGDTILKDDIIHQWIALGLVEPYGNLSITQVAEEYITRLLDISFLQTAESDASTSGSGDRGAILLTMHELAHALARSVCDELIVPDERMCTYECCRYAVLTDFGMKLSDKLPTQLRAVRCTGCSKMDLGDDAFSFTRCLRVLHLNKCSMQKLPDSICRLRQLGYLNLSGCSQLVSLPESFGSLFNLWHINLSRCYGLAQLPESFKKLRRLVYLDLSFWRCFEGISVLGGLTSLKHLNLSHPCCYSAEHRPHLEGLKDILCKLTNLQYLNLSMCMNPIFSYLPEEQCREYIRSCASGLSKLKHLDLSHNIFLVGLPESLGELQKLHTLDLTGCIRLKTVAKRISENESLKLITRNCRDLKSRSIVVCTDDGGFRSNLVQLEDEKTA